MRREGRCVTAEVDLEALATAYSHRPASAASLRRFEELATSARYGSWAVDVGGGRGAHAGVLAEHGLRAIVLDPSRSMLAAALAHGVAVVAGTSQAMPFRSGTMGLVTFHLSIHYGSWPEAVDEAIRVLEPGGLLAIWTLGPDHHVASMLARWFPSVAAIDARRFPDPDQVADHLGRRSGAVEVRPEVERVTRSAGDWEDAVTAGFVSTLQLITPSELATGLDAFREEHPDRSAAVTYDLRYTRITARR